jgi:hypothetical protein
VDKREKLFHSRRNKSQSNLSAGLDAVQEVYRPKYRSPENKFIMLSKNLNIVRSGSELEKYNMLIQSKLKQKPKNNSNLNQNEIPKLQADGFVNGKNNNSSESSINNHNLSTIPSFRRNSEDRRKE